jgi:DNA-binding NarL/FixJ family response regulator
MERAMFEKCRPRIIIADDHTLIAEACKQLLETEFEVLSIVNNGQALIDAVCRMNPDVALVDISMPLLNGLDACEHIRGIKRTVKIVFLTMNADRAMAAEAFRRGASGFLPKTAASAELPVAIRTVLKGRRYISPLIGDDSFDLRVEFEGTNGVPGPLTTRQKQVVQLLAEGKSMKEVASDLTLTPRTVAFHKYRVMEILNLKNNAELVQYAMKEHMVASK